MLFVVVVAGVFLSPECRSEFDFRNGQSVFLLVKGQNVSVSHLCQEQNLAFHSLGDKKERLGPYVH